MQTDTPPKSAERIRIPLRDQLPVYAAGIFSNGASHLVTVILPLWVVMIDPSPLMIGVALGSRQILPVLFSIPRAVGWIAQWEEMLLDSEQKIARPRQVYLGAEKRNYVGMRDR